MQAALPQTRVLLTSRYALNYIFLGVICFLFRPSFNSTRFAYSELEGVCSTCNLWMPHTCTDPCRSASHKSRTDVGVPLSWLQEGRRISKAYRTTLGIRCLVVSNILFGVANLQATASCV